jgi:hypothetical protein
MPMDGLEDDGCQAVHLVTPLRILKRLTGLQQQLQIAQIAVTQRVVATESLRG